MALFFCPQPVVLKEDSSARKQLAALESLRGTLAPGAEKQLEADIRAVQAGIVGEDRVMYELKNSHMDMFVLQDLYLEYAGLSAQIDFLIITLQRIFVLECKNLYGNIEVNSRGDFIRSFGGRKKEGIYSPITQNQRHLDLIHAMKRENRSFAMNLLVDGDFSDLYRPLVVLANPKTVLNDRYATRQVKNKLIRADNLVTTIKAINNEKGPGRDKSLKSAAQRNAEWFLSQHKENPIDYTAKYREMSDPATETQQSDLSQIEADATEKTIMCPRCGSPMVLRTAKRGTRAGKQFYGCSNYPACHGIVNIGE